MKLSDYMSKERFPLTTQPGLSANGQFIIDAVNHDAIRDRVVGTPEMTPAMVQRYAELEAKVAAQPALLKELRAAAEQQPGAEDATP